MRVPVLCLFVWLSACGGGKKPVAEPDLGVALGADFSSNGRLGDSCVDDDQCDTKHCITVTEWPNGPFHICGQRCGDTDGGASCLEGTCGTRTATSPRRYAGDANTSGR